MNSAQVLLGRQLFPYFWLSCISISRGPPLICCLSRVEERRIISIVQLCSFLPVQEVQTVPGEVVVSPFNSILELLSRMKNTVYAFYLSFLAPSERHMAA